MLSGNNQVVCIYFASMGVRNIAVNMMYVCRSVSLHISNITRPDFTKFSVHVTYGRGSDLL